MIHNRRPHRRFRNPANAIARSCSALLESLEPRQHLTVTTLTRASVNTAGDPTSFQSGYGVISADANWVAFQSTATNLVTGDTNGFTDVFLRDLRNNTTIRISLPALGGGTGDEGDQNSTDPAISADGRYVAFLSNASNLVANDTNDAPDVFLYDRLGNGGAGTISRISVDSDELQADSSSSPPSISGDGKFVVFHSNAANLVANDTNEFSDIFLRDVDAGTTTLISKNPGGLAAQGNDASYNPAISADGSVIAFISNASNFSLSDTNAFADVFVVDRTSGTLERVSIKSGLDTAANQANGAAGQRVALSSDGKYVVFESGATNLVSAADANGKTDIFLRFRSGDSSTTTRISQTSAAVVGNGESTFASISSNGRYIIYESTATNLVSGDTTVGRYHIYSYDRIANTTRRVSVSAAGTVANDDSRYPSFSADGQYASFFSKASNLIQLDNNGVGDIFANVAPRAAVSGTPDGNNPHEISAGDTSPDTVDGTDFGVLDVSAGTASHVFTIRNDGTAPLNLTGTPKITITGANAADFSVLVQPLEGSLDPGETATFTVKFDPSAPGPRVAQVIFLSDDPSVPSYSFNITGYATDDSIASRVVVQQAGVNVTPGAPFSFDNLGIGSAPKALTFTVLNASSQTLTLDPVALTGVTGNTGFEIVNSLGTTTLAPGRSTTFSIRMNAISAGAKTATVTLVNTGTDTKTFSFDLSGLITVPEMKVTQNGSAVTSGSTIAFGNVVKGSSSTSKTFTIRNDGLAPLILGAITPPNGFSVTSAPPSTIAAGATATITITLSSATAVGAKSGALTIVTNDPTVGTFTLNLTGAVTAPGISVTFNGAAFTSGTTIAFGSASTGQTVSTKSIVVTNTGTATLNLGAINTTDLTKAGFTLVTSSAAQTIAPGASATISFRLATTSLGAKSFDLSFSTNAEGFSSIKAKLTGTVNSQPLALFIDGVAATGQTVAFGTLPQSNTTVKKTLTLRNDGAITLNLGDVDVPAGFILSSNLSSATLAPGAAASFSVSLTPRSSGALSGVLSIPTDEANREKYVLGLTANVTAANKTGLGVATVTLSKLPNPVLGGTSAAVGNATVTLQNFSAATVAGTYKITLYASEGPFNEPGDKILGTLNVKVNLAKNAKSSHGVNLKFPAPAVDGKYNVVAVVTGAKADPVYSVGKAPFTVQIEKAQAKVGQSGTASKLNSKLGQKITQSVTLSNSGNSAIAGTATGILYLSKDGTVENATKITTLSGLKINIAKSKGTQKLTFSATLPKKLPAGYGAKGTYKLVLKITKIASGTASMLLSDGVVNAGNIKLT